MPEEGPKPINDTLAEHFAQIQRKNVKLDDKKADNKPQFTTKLALLLEQYKKNDVEKILDVFSFLTKQYGENFIHQYGHEPDKPFCDTVSALNQQEIERLQDNVSDRLARGSFRIPNHGNLQLLAQRPTTAEIEKAIINIFDKRLTPMNLNRVEKFFSENYFHEFNRKSETFHKDFEKRYINTWRSVMLYIAAMLAEKHSSK